MFWTLVLFPQDLRGRASDARTRPLVSQRPVLETLNRSSQSPLCSKRPAGHSSLRSLAPPFPTANTSLVCGGDPEGQDPLGGDLLNVSREHGPSPASRPAHRRKKLRRSASALRRKLHLAPFLPPLPAANASLVCAGGPIRAKTALRFLAPPLPARSADLAGAP